MNKILSFSCFVFVTILFYLPSTVIQAQSFDWVFTSPGLNAANTLSLTTDMEKDAAGNIYIAGTINGSSTWGTDTITSSEPFPDVFLPSAFIACLGPDGTLHWFEEFTSSGATAKIEEMEVDDAGNIYLLASFAVDIVIDGMVLDAPFGNNNGIAIVKLNSNLEIEWANVNGPQFLPDGIIMTDLKLGTNNSLYVSGQMSGMINFWGVTLDVTFIGTSFYILELNTEDGMVNWGNAFGYNAEAGSGARMAVDDSNNIYFAAGHIGEADYEGTVLGAENVTTIILSKWNADGELQWATGTETNSNFELGNTAFDVSVGMDGVYMTGGFASSELNFGNGVVLTRDLPGSSDFYVAKFNTQGDAIWARQSSSLTQGIAGKRIASTSDGGVIIGGRFSGNGQDIVFLDDTNPITTSSVATTDLFFVKYSSSGNLMWFKKTDGFGEKDILGMTLTGLNSVAFTGYYTSEFIIAGTTLVPTPTPTARNLFVGHCAGDQTNTYSPQSQLDWKISPNPSDGRIQLDMDIPLNKSMQFEMFDLLGKKVYQQDITDNITIISLTWLPSGSYFIKLSNKNFIESKLIVID